MQPLRCRGHPGEPRPRLIASGRGAGVRSRAGSSTGQHLDAAAEPGRTRKPPVGGDQGRAPVFPPAPRSSHRTRVGTWRSSQHRHSTRRTSTRVTGRSKRVRRTAAALASSMASLARCRLPTARTSGSRSAGATGRSPERRRLAGAPSEPSSANAGATTLASTTITGPHTLGSDRLHGGPERPRSLPAVPRQGRAPLRVSAGAPPCREPGEEMLLPGLIRGGRTAAEHRMDILGNRLVSGRLAWGHCGAAPPRRRKAGMAGAAGTPGLVRGGQVQPFSRHSLAPAARSAQAAGVSPTRARPGGRGPECCATATGPGGACPHLPCVGQAPPLVHGRR